MLVFLTGLTTLGMQNSSPVVTFNRDVLPILQKNCQTCHHSGGVAPMSFQTYETTRPWAKAMKAAVLNKQMPPWFADARYGDFRNAPNLTQSDVKTLAAWADTGASEGSPTDKPADPQWTEGWRIKPDVVVSMREPYRIAAKGSGQIKEFVIPNPFKEDTWVSSIEIRPGDPSVVHHVIVQIPDEPFKPIAAIFPEVPLIISEKTLGKADGAASEGGGGPYSGGSERRTGRGAFATMEAVYAPGSPPLDFRFSDSAKLIRGKTPIRLEVHYTPNGKDTTDRTMVGFTLAKGPAQRRFIIMAPEHMADPRKPIPPGEANWETTGELTFNQSAELVWFMPHMHLRGKDMTFRLIYPNGRQETVLSARFNFDWQLGYEVAEPIEILKGTRMVITAHYDNSANNPGNPAPDKPVEWGQMTADEMMLPWFGVVVDRDAKPDAIATYKRGDFDGPLPGPQFTNGRRDAIFQLPGIKQ
jgi:hypothetical protein